MYSNSIEGEILMIENIPKKKKKKNYYYRIIFIHLIFFM